MTKNQERHAVWMKFDGHCAYCGKLIKYKDMQVDHQEPKANRRPIGRDLLGNYIYPDIERFENKMPSCRRCNHYKRAEPLEYFRILIKTVHERIHNFYIAKVAEDYNIIEYKPWDGKFYFEKPRDANQ
jgi:5-methylcytosine-specific restriction endonuclease McrA